MTGVQTCALPIYAGMRAHLREEAQALDDAAVQVDQFGFVQPVNVDFHRAIFLGSDLSGEQWRMSTLRR